MKKKSYVPLNDPAEAFLIFRDELTPELTEVRGEKVYITIFTHPADAVGEPHLVVVDQGLKLKFWTSFVPEEESYVARMRRGKLLWKPES